MKLSELKKVIKHDYKNIKETQKADNREIESALGDLKDDGVYNDVVAEAEAIVASWNQKKLQEKKTGKRPDYADVDKDKDKKEPMEKAFKDKAHKKSDKAPHQTAAGKGITVNEVDVNAANYDDLAQVVKNIAHIEGIKPGAAAMNAIEYIAERFGVKVEFDDFM